MVYSVCQPEIVRALRELRGSTRIVPKTNRSAIRPRGCKRNRLTDTNPYLALLAALEAELRRQGQWEAAPPPRAAFESVLPFSCDTLRFTQWLQWIFIPHTRAVVQSGGPMPVRSGIRAMAEEALGGCRWDAAGVIDLIGRFDVMINLNVR